MTAWEGRAVGPETLHSPVRGGSGGPPGVSRHHPPCIGVVIYLDTIFLGQVWLLSEELFLPDCLHRPSFLLSSTLFQ